MRCRRADVTGIAGPEEVQQLLRERRPIHVLRSLARSRSEALAQRQVRDKYAQLVRELFVGDGSKHKV